MLCDDVFSSCGDLSSCDLVLLKVDQGKKCGLRQGQLSQQGRLMTKHVQEVLPISVLLRLEELHETDLISDSKNSENLPQLWKKWLSFWHHVVLEREVQLYF